MLAQLPPHPGTPFSAANRGTVGMTPGAPAGPSPPRSSSPHPPRACLADPAMACWLCRVETRAAELRVLLGSRWLVVTIWEFLEQEFHAYPRTDNLPCLFFPMSRSADPCSPELPAGP